MATISLATAASPTELAYVAASSISNTQERTEALKGVVGFAVKRGEFKTAIAAAVAIPNTYDQAEQLKIVAQALQAPTMANKGTSAP